MAPSKEVGPLRKIMVNKKKIVVAVSGGFDPIHVGHIRCFIEAKKLGGELVIILKNDYWLMKKKGFVFMPQEERKEVLESLESVDRVMYSTHIKDDVDESVSEALRKLRPDIFANGGDSKLEGNLQIEVCKEIVHTLHVVIENGKAGVLCINLSRFKR